MRLLINCLKLLKIFKWKFRNCHKNLNTLRSMAALSTLMSVLASISLSRHSVATCQTKTALFISGARSEVSKQIQIPNFFLLFTIGTIRDYYICYYLTESTQNEIVPCKCFFWCSSTNFIFSSLPKPSTVVCEKLRTFPSLFTGEFDQVLVQSNAQPKVIDAANGIILPPKHLTELDRLSVVVHQIDKRCSAVPRGVMKYTASHQVCQNEAFRGLSCQDAMNLCNWQHMRAVCTDEKKELIARHEAIYNDRFLDELESDMPNKCWSVLSDVTKTVAIIRSQLWPGFFAYHRCNTNIHGCVYIGDGLRNHDLAFML